MKLKENVWYIIDKEPDRNEFIYDLCCAMKITKTQLIARHPEVQTAKVIKYKRKCCDPITFDINYRTEFKPDYLQGPREHYEPRAIQHSLDIPYDTIKQMVLNCTIKDNLKPPTLEPLTITGTVGPMNIQEELEKFKPYIKNNKDNTLTKIYEGENKMTCSNEYNEKYLIQQYFETEEKKLTEMKEKERDEYLNNTAIYTSAKNFVNILNHNKSNPFTTVPTPLAMIKEYLSKDQMEALNKINEKYNEEVEEVRKKCKVVESLINMCDNADQKMDILRRYEIIKLPKMPK